MSLRAELASEEVMGLSYDRVGGGKDLWEIDSAFARRG
jgi:hypothetical protein